MNMHLDERPDAGAQAVYSIRLGIGVRIGA